MPERTQNEITAMGLRSIGNRVLHYKRHKPLPDPENEDAARRVLALAAALLHDVASGRADLTDSVNALIREYHAA